MHLCCLLCPPSVGYLPLEKAENMIHTVQHTCISCPVMCSIEQGPYALASLDEK